CTPLRPNPPPGQGPPVRQCRQLTTSPAAGTDTTRPCAHQCVCSHAIATAPLVYYFYYVRGLMDVGLTSEQLALRDTVRDILRTECPPDAARQAMTDPERWRTLWKTVV